MAEDTLSEVVAATAARFRLPGVAIGVWADGREVYACHGVTSVDNPLPVDRDTLYVLGSVTKTYTATALMCLVAGGQVELDAPVRRYVPELRLADERAAAEITVLNLLNHTAGLDWRMIVDTGEGDDAQFAELLTVPERGFAVVSLSNAGPDGIPFNQAVVRWALETYLGVMERDPEPLPYDDARAREVVGSYETDAQALTIGTSGARLTLAVGIKPELRAAAQTEMPPDYPPADIGLLPGDADEYVVISGGLAGQRGFFTRDESGAIIGVDLAGRLFQRVPTASA